jgi:UDP-N-acetylglucosamine:LPS N-acetylglucosamine transferase
MSRVGAALVVPDAVMTGEMLCTTVAQLAGPSGRLESMAAAARQFAKPGAARRAAEILEEVSRS